MGLQPKAFLFDKDGTLLDFTATYGPAIPLIITELCGERTERIEPMAGVLGFDLETGRFAEDSFLIASSTDDYMADFAEAAGLTATAELGERIDDLFRKFALPHVTALAGARELLEKLRGLETPLGIATNDAEVNTHMQLEAARMIDRFDFVAGYDSGFGRKPGPGQITAFAAKCRVQPCEVAMIGDSTHDLIAARAAGAIAVAVTSGFSDEAVLAPHADLIFTGVDELLARFDEIGVWTPLMRSR